MTSSLRIALGVLLSLALALHGSAGATRLGCAAPAMAGASLHEGHAAHPAHAMHADEGHASRSPQSPTADHACCVAAIPSDPMTMDAAANGDTFWSFAAPTPPVFLTEGPERPPRYPDA